MRPHERLELELDIINRYNSNPGLSVQQVALEYGMAQSTVSRIFKRHHYNSASRVPDYTNRRFARLLVIGITRNAANRKMLLCKCDCGSEYLAQPYWLTKGGVKSCGCLQKEQSYTNTRKHGHTVNYNKTTEYKMYISAKVRAKKHNIPFNLELEDITIPNTCPVFPNITLVSHAGFVHYDSPTLDRIIPELGYTKGNIRIISQKANTIKTNATYTDIRQVADWLEHEMSIHPNKASA